MARPVQPTAFRRILMALVVVSAACGREIATTPPTTKGGTVTVVSDTTVYPAGPEGAAARRGFAILAATRDSMPQYVSAGLRCFSCHLDNGRRANSVPLTNAYTRYPTYTTRDDRVISIQDRVNNCVTRSLAGRDIPIDGDQMNAIVLYLSVMSRGVPAGAHLKGEGMPSLPQLGADKVRGESIFTARCARCHGQNGQGIPPATPLWGPRAFSVGASLARVSRAATFIRNNMPFDSAGVLSNQQAYDVAAYVLSHPRPDTPGKENDWASGGAPDDVPYNTRGHAAFNPPPLLPRAVR